MYSYNGCLTTRLCKCVYNLETQVVRVIFNVHELDLRRYNPILQSGHHPVYCPKYRLFKPFEYQCLVYICPAMCLTARISISVQQPYMGGDSRTSIVLNTPLWFCLKRLYTF